MKYIKMTQDLSLKLNDYIDPLIIKYAMFDSNFTDEYLYYKNANYNEIGILNNYIYAIEDNDNYIGYLVLNLFKDDNKIGCSINPIIVFNKFKNKGYGTKILNDDFNNLVKEKIDYLECLVDIDNIASYKLFIKNGFKEYKRENNFIYLKKNY